MRILSVASLLAFAAAKVDGTVSFDGLILDGWTV